jgi:hypothetical protein
VFTRALHWSLSWARSFQSIPSHPISLRFILIYYISASCCIRSHSFLFQWTGRLCHINQKNTVALETAWNKNEGSILILSTHLRLGLPSGLLPSAFPPISYMHSSSPMLGGSLFTTAWRVFRLRMEETPSSFGG